MIDEKKLLEKLNTWCDALSPETDIGDSIKCDVIDTVIMMIRNTKKVGEWIPVSERLPDVDVNVLVTYKDDDNNLAIDTDYRDKIINDWLYFGDNVTAWQPLPEPCREESAAHLVESSKIGDGAEIICDWEEEHDSNRD